MIGHILQLNENKLALHMLGQIMNRAEKEGILNEKDFMTLSEKDVMERLDSEVVSIRSSAHSTTGQLARLYKTFRSMTSIEHTDMPLDENEYFCVNLKVKQRYINPLVRIETTTRRLSDVSEKAQRIIDDFKTYSDTAYGCVKLV